MTAEDIDEKWLFVAYSAKKEGVEDNLTGKSKDYRDKISSERTFAGAKGIGRFSCDRLGRFLNLYTRADTNGNYQHLKVDWQDFETDSSKEFVDVTLERKAPTKIPHELSSGTILEISGLRGSWDRDRLKKLRDSLRKLINPNQENDAKRFNVRLKAIDEKEADSKEPEKRDRINGPIKNFLFEELGLKATEIHCEVDAKSETIQTTLSDRGTLIYRITERCPYDHLGNVQIHLFALNRAAKALFTKVMGVHNLQYGSVFLYKNGFRVHPIGNEGDDSLGIDHRKQQGQSRFIGTRDLSGRIEVTGDNKTFKEASSRDAGIIKSPEWQELLDFFYDYALKRLEKYAIEIIKWGNIPDGANEELRPGDVKAQILDVINKLTGSDSVLNIEYDSNLLDIIAERQSTSVTTALTNFRRIAELEGNDSLRRDVARTERQIKALAAAKDEAETETKIERRARAVSEKKLAVEKKKNTFLLATSSDPDRQRLNLQHWIAIAAPQMRDTISKMVRGVNTGTIEKQKLLEGFSQLQLWLDQVVSVSRVVTRADFDMQYETIREDLARFIFEYLGSDVTAKPSKLKFLSSMRPTPL